MSVYLYGDYILDKYIQASDEDPIECPGGASNVMYSLTSLIITNAINAPQGKVLATVLNSLKRISYSDFLTLHRWESYVASFNYWKDNKIVNRVKYPSKTLPNMLYVHERYSLGSIKTKVNYMIVSDYNRGAINLDHFMESGFNRSQIDIVLIDDKYKRNIINRKGLFRPETIFILKHEKTEEDPDVSLILKRYKEADYLTDYVILNLNDRIYLLDINLQQIVYCFKHEPNDTLPNISNVSGAGDVFMSSLSYYLISKYPQRPIEACLSEAIHFAYEIAKGSCELPYTGFYECHL